MSDGFVRKRHDRKFKLQVVAEYHAGVSSVELGRKYRINPNMISRWVREVEKNPDDCFAGNGKIASQEARIAQLERMVGRLTMEKQILQEAKIFLDRGGR